MRIRIPETFRPALKKIAELPEPAFAQFLSALEKIRPAVSERRLAKTLSASAPLIPADDVGDIIGVIGSLYLVQLREEVPVERLASDVSAALQKELSPEARGLLSTRLAAMLTSKAMALSVKASDLQKQHTRVLLNCRIFTDIRPVFGDAGELSLSGVMIIHKLKLSVAENLESKDIYITLDDDDVEALQKVLARASAKAKLLRSALRQVKITDFDSENDNGTTGNDHIQENR